MQIVHRHIGNRIVFIAAVIAAVALVAYFAVIPMVVAHYYMNRMNTAILQARADIKAVSTGSNIVIFQDPDITLTERQAHISKTLGALKTAQQSLDNMQAANALPALPGVSFVPKYHEATVRHARANNAIRQSRQVLDTYGKGLTYIDAYTTPLLHLDNELQYINGIRDFNALGNGSTMKGAAVQLQADYDQLSSLTPPPGFQALHNGALNLLTQASTAFQHLGDGLDQHSDSATYDAAARLEQLDDSYEAYNLNTLTQLAQSSANLQQLVELPEKIEHVGGI